MKKMLLATAALALLITRCAQQTFTVQNKPAAVAPKVITHHFFVSDWAEENCRCSEFVAAQKMLLKQKPSKHYKWLLPVLLL